MAEQTLVFLGSIIIGLLVLTLAYRILTVSISQSQYQAALSSFNSFYTDIQSVCQQEIENSVKVKYQIPIFVKVVYFSYDDIRPPVGVNDLILNQEISEGDYLCLQFKQQQDLKCQKIECIAQMPYIGALEEYNDLQLAVNKILGKPLIKEYTLLIKKNFYGTLEVIPS
ncbi:MAG: hypothetical protein KQA41_01635 [Candidatus Aenigmarchaeota archaeon]|nr:hypothetical protein [Candidatus Aenigmarchaeota archaeon]MBU5688910.1 hypothetical protein [Candidatus Aenigmarchaeota archaeon]